LFRYKSTWNAENQSDHTEEDGWNTKPVNQFVGGILMAIAVF
jgi:hypothetical protein